MQNNESPSTTTHEWLDTLNDEYGGIAKVENGGDWVRYDLPSGGMDGTDHVSIVVDGELEVVRVYGLNGYALCWDARFGLDTPFHVVAATVAAACGIFLDA